MPEAYHIVNRIQDQQDYAGTAPQEGEGLVWDGTAWVNAAVVQEGDGRLDDSRTPTSHASSHASDGSDPVSPASIGAALSGHTHAGTYDPAGTAASAVSAHVAASDPHTQYAQESALGDAAYKNTGTGSTQVAAGNHTHAAAGNVTYNSAWASPPASPNSGDLWWPPDSPYKLRYNGTSWDYYLNGLKVTPPVSGDFSWVNQGSATIDTSNGGVYLSMAAGTGSNFRLRMKAVPTAPYTVTMAYVPSLYRTNYMSTALVLYDGTKMVTLAFGTNNTGAELSVQKFNTVSSFSANYVTISPATYPQILWLRITDNSTNRITYFSFDGIHWQQLHSVSRTDFLTPTQIGFGVDPNNATYAAGMWLLHWEQS